MSNILELKREDAIKAYNKGTTADRSLLENLYGKEVFNQKITDRVKSFEDACAVLGIVPGSVYSDYNSTDEVAYNKLKVIARALNEGWKPNWNNSNEYKYYPYFLMQGGFSFSSVFYLSSYTFVGSRLCFRSRELAAYAGQQFLNLYKDFYVIPD